MRIMIGLVLASMLGAQSRQLFRPPVGLPPSAVERHLRSGHDTYRAELQSGARDPEGRTRPAPDPAEAGHRPASEAEQPRSRPAGAGRHLAVLLGDCEIEHEPTELLRVDRRDLLQLSSPGPVADAGVIARLERAVEVEKTALCLILVREDSASLRPALPLTPAHEKATRAEKAHAARTHRSRARAERTGQSAAGAHARVQRETVLQASAVLRKAKHDGRFGFLLGVVDGRTGAIRWLENSPLRTKEN